MPFCSNCGAQIEEGEICNCRQDQQQQVDSDQPPPNQEGQLPDVYVQQQPDQYVQPPPNQHLRHSLDQYEQQPDQYAQPLPNQHVPPQTQYWQPPPNQYWQPPNQNVQPPNQYWQPPPNQYWQRPPGQNEPQPNQYWQLPQNQYMQPPPNWQGSYALLDKQAKPGRTMVRVTGILMTVFGALAVGITVSALSVSSIFGQLFKALLCFEIFGAAMTLAFGISGLVMAGYEDKGGIIRGFGVAILAYKVIDIVWAIGAFNSYAKSYVINISIAIVGCILPILFIIGGNTMKNARQPL